MIYHIWDRRDDASLWCGRTPRKALLAYLASINRTDRLEDYFAFQVVKEPQPDHPEWDLCPEEE